VGDVMLGTRELPAARSTRETRVLQTTFQIVDAGNARLLFALGERMNWRLTEGKVLNGVGGANSFRACIGCLLDPLLAADS